MDRTFRETKPEITFFSTTCLDFPAHLHEDIEVVYVKKSTGFVHCDGKAYPLTEGSFFLSFPNQVHHYSESASGEYILLIVKPLMLMNGNDLFFKGHPTSSLCTHADAHTVTLLHMALEEFEQSGYSPVIGAYLTAFFEKLVTFYDIEKGTVSTDTVLRILQYCAEHYKDEISIADIARDLHISRSSVSHIFSTRLGISFSDHMHTLRLSDAVHLLKNKHYSVTEIAEMAGFPTIRTFNRVFQRQYGMSPTAYRKSLHE